MNTEKNMRADGGALPQKLAQTALLLNELGQPHRALRCIHIAGTNGKGSTAAFISQILQEAGYRAGLFTSPHLGSYHERFCVNGAPIADDALRALQARVGDAAKAAQLPPNYFREATAIAFTYFHESRCDIAVLETGMGGRLDPTNIVQAPLLTVITRIGMDHEAFLGDTIETIAAEKAGIIKAGSPLVYLAQDPRAECVIEEKALALSVPARRVCPLPIVRTAGGLVLQGPFGRLRSGMGGAYQTQNAALAVEAAVVLKERGLRIKREHIETGISRARWPGRFELLRSAPPILLDGAHNPQGVGALIKSIKMQWPGYGVIWVMGVMRDKAYRDSLSMLAPSASAFVAVPVEGERALSARSLANEMRLRHGRVYEGGSVEEGLRIAMGLQTRRDVICVCGSLYLAAPARKAGLGETEIRG